MILHGTTMEGVGDRIVSHPIPKHLQLMKGDYLIKLVRCTRRRTKANIYRRHRR